MHIVATSRLYRLALWFLTGSSLLFLSLAAFFLLPRATIVITVKSQPARLSTTAQIDTRIHSSLPGLDTIPARFSSKQTDSVGTLRIIEKDYSEDFVIPNGDSMESFVISTGDLFEVARAKLTLLAGEDVVIVENSLAIDITNVTARSNNEAATLEMIISGKTISPINKDLVLAGNTHKTKAEVLHRIALLPNVEKAEISLFPAFFPWLPYRDSAIHISLDII